MPGSILAIALVIVSLSFSLAIFLLLLFAPEWREKARGVASIQDLLRAFALALDPLKFKLQFGGNVLTIFVLAAFLGAANAIMPHAPQGIAIAFFLWLPVGYAILMLALGAVAAVTMGDFGEARPTSWRVAVVAAWERSSGLLGGPLSLLAVVGAGGLVLAALGYAGKLPIVGEMVWALTYLPQFVVAVAMALAVVGLAISVLLIPAIAMAEHGGALATADRLFMLLRHAPLSLGVFLLISIFLLALTGSLLLLVYYAALVITNTFGIAIMQEKFNTMVQVVPAGLNPFGALTPFPEFGFARSNWSLRIAGLLWGLANLLLFAAVACYPAIFMTVCGTVTFLGLRDQIPTAASWLPTRFGPKIPPLAEPAPQEATPADKTGAETLAGWMPPAAKQ